MEYYFDLPINILAVVQKSSNEAQNMNVVIMIIIAVIIMLTIATIFNNKK